MKMYRSTLIKNTQRGATLIEMMVFVALGLIVLAVAGATIAMTINASNISTDSENLGSVLIHTRDLRDVSGYGAAGTDLVPQLAKIKGIPANMTVVGGVPYNYWNGAITNVSTGLGYTVTTPNLPQDACVKQTTKLSMPGTYSVSINGGAAIVGLVTQAAAQAGCSGATNTIAFTSLN